ncbi:MAG TPA: TonB-dependent receptor, partial [Saprospiraceae bacterium]|nr:TonB-dependent receptor [Saprospiraceae bacterium]
SNATHYIANVQTVTSDFTFRSELFYKKYNDLIKTSPDTALSGTGYAQGIEFFWRDKKTLKYVDYWISYSYLDTKRNWLDFPISTTPSFAATHTANLVFKKFFTKIRTNLSATYTFATGRPYYNPNKPDSEYLSDRTASYNALGISASYLTTVAKAFTVIVFSVTNVTGAKQVFGYRYSSDGMIKSEINPPAPRFFFLGVFMSWGIDRTQDVLDNN